MPSPLETIATASESQDPVVKAREDYLRKVEALEKQQNALIESLGVRSPSDTFLSMAQGFLAPTRTGSFGESFGTGIGQLRGSQAAEEKRAEEIAKMRLAIGTQQLGTEKEKLQMVKDLALAQGIQGMLGGTGATAGRAGHAMVPGTPGASVMATPESAGFARPAAPAAAPAAQNFAQRLSPQARALLGAQASSDPNKVLEYLLKGEAEDAKVADAIKTADYYLQGLPEHLRTAGREAAASMAVFGKPEEGFKTLADLGKAVREGYISNDIFLSAVRSLPSLTQARGSLAQPATPPTATTPATQAPAPAAAPQRTSVVTAPPAAPAAPSTAISLAGGPQAPSAVAATIESRGAQEPGAALSPAQQAEIEAEKRKQINKTEIEQAADARKKIMSPAQTADQRISEAKLGYDIVKKTPGAFGIFATPGIASAIGTLAQSGIGVGPSFRLNIPEIQAAALALGGTQQEIDARSKLLQIGIRAQMEFAAATAKGSISNFEQELYQKTGVNANDSPNVILFKLELMRVRAEAEKLIASEYRKYEKARVGSAEDFMNSEKYQSIQKSYDDVLARIESAYSSQRQGGR